MEIEDMQPIWALCRREPNMFKVLIIEDDINLADTISKILITSDYEPVVSHDGTEGLERAMNERFDAVLLDVMLPGTDGITICKTLKESGSKVPILMISAKSQVDDRIRGLEVGADDYIPKPFEYRELIARIKAVARRTSPMQSARIRFGNLEFFPETGEIVCGSESAALSEKEALLMAELMRDPGQTCRKEALLEAIWGDEEHADMNNVEAYVSFVRKKLAFVNTNVEIKTLRKLGYKLDVSL